ncbi:MAG: hypothetical protein ABIB71_06605 [Candidatus Woesearchaeota archaeon]
MRKAQVTIFVVLGIVLAAIIVGLVVMRQEIAGSLQSKGIIEDIYLSEEVKELRDDVEYCLEESLKESLLLTASRGGYYKVPETAISYDGYYAPLYFDNGEENIPSKADMERSISSAIESRIKLCNIGEAEPLSEPYAETTLLEGRAEAELQYRLVIMGSETSSFSAEADTSFLEDFSKVKELYNRQKNIEGVLAIGELAILADEKDYELYFDYAEGARLYFLTFEDNGRPSAFAFAIRNEG